MNTIDLQIQSTASDGKHSPRELVEMAKSNGLKAIALTDHDTIGGVEEALLAGRERGVRVIPGIEMSVEEHDAHILGYGLDYKNPALLKELEKFQQGRIEGAKKMVEKFKEAGFALDWEDVLREAKGTVARPHIVRAILKRPENKEKLGPVKTAHDFFEAYFQEGSPFFVKRTHISAKDAIALLRGAGGLAIWSHPALHFKNDYPGLEEFLQKLIGWGIDGIEVFNPSHTEDDVEFLQGLAIKYNLLRTAGSDFHTTENAQVVSDRGLRSAATVGDYNTFGFSTEDIMAVLDGAMARR